MGKYNVNALECNNERCQRNTDGESERGRKGSCEGFPREGAPELDLRGKAEGSARWTRGRENRTYEGTEARE